MRYLSATSFSSTGILLPLLVAITFSVACGNDSSRESNNGLSDAENQTDADIQSALRARLDTTRSDAEVPASLSQEHREDAQEAYGNRDFRPIWTGGSEARARAEDLLREIAQAEHYALNPSTFDLQPVRDALQSAYGGEGDSAQEADELAEADLQLSALFLEFGSRLSQGPFSPESVGAQWHVESPDPDLARALERVASGDPVNVLTGLASRHDSYDRLQEALGRYREIEQGGGFPTVPDGDVLTPGDSSSRVLDLRARLAAEGYANDSATSDSTFDEALAGALAEFQETHGLATDSILGDNALSALNVSAAERARQIQVNLVRWHWMPVDLGGRYVFVNLPEYRLHAYEDGEEELSMRVVVGAEYDERATPAFSDRIAYAEFRPYWNVPTSIARDELVDEGAQYLRENDFEIVRRFDVSESETLPLTPENLDAVAEGTYFLRERPGPDNALGKVKYMFPNDFDIYLHDTPEDHLFDERERAFSHGCIRVEDPPSLGAFLFEDREWDAEDVRRRMNEGSPSERVDLEQPVPVFILYFTAFVDEDGRAHFREDLYGYDEPIADALAEQEIEQPEVDVQELIDLLPS